LLKKQQKTLWGYFNCRTLYKANTHQNRFRLGLRPRPRWGAYSAPRTSSWILRALLPREGRGRGEEGKEESEKGEGRKGKEKGDLPYDLGDLEMTWLP